MGQVTETNIEYANAICWNKKHGENRQHNKYLKIVANVIQAPEIKGTNWKYTCGLLATFSGWFAHLCFGLGRGPIIPPGPEMVVIDRKDLNKKKYQQILSAYWATFLWWFAHLCFDLGRGPITLPVPQWSYWTEET